MKKLLSLSLSLLFLIGSLSSCKKNHGSAPTLPPAESLTIDFSNFVSQKKSADVLTDFKGTNSENWSFAAKSVSANTWKVIINTLAVPVSAFKRAIDEDPVFVSDKLWQWSYSVSSVAVTYKARLTGQIGSTEVTWKMYISSEGPTGFPEFLWFEGTSKIDGTGGKWTFYQSAPSPVAYLQIDWTKTSETINTIKYTYLKIADPFGTSYIEYGHLTGIYDSFYTIHYWDSDKVKFVDVNVEWNKSTSIGRVKSSEYLDGAWYLWNTNHSNV